MFRVIKVVLLLLLFLSNAYALNKSKINKREELFEKARFEISRGSYDLALAHLNEYRKLNTKTKKRSVNSFYAIEAIGRIYLRFKQDPDAAIKFFSTAMDDQNLTDSEFDIIKTWLGRAREWKDLSQLPKNIKDPKKLFELGKKYFDHGLKTQKYIMDISASADFSLASIYLVPFTIHFDKDPNIGEALYMMGEIRRRSWQNNKYWTENFYLIEVIRRFPGTELALKAYQALYDDVHFGYTGSSGDNTPESWVELLAEFKNLSEFKAPEIPAVN